MDSQVQWGNRFESMPCPGVCRKSSESNFTTYGGTKIDNLLHKTALVLANELTEAQSVNYDNKINLYLWFYDSLHKLMSRFISLIYILQLKHLPMLYEAIKILLNFTGTTAVEI